MSAESQAVKRQGFSGAQVAAIVVVAILLTAAPFGVWLLGQIEYMELSYTSEDLRRTHERLIEDHRRLERERAALESLESIEDWALGQRGLVAPDAGQIVVVRPASEPPADWMARDVSR